jgi:hypothetical protein
MVLFEFDLPTPVAAELRGDAKKAGEDFDTFCTRLLEKGLRKMKLKEARLGSK